MTSTCSSGYEFIIILFLFVTHMSTPPFLIPVFFMLRYFEVFGVRVSILIPFSVRYCWIA